MASQAGRSQSGAKPARPGLPTLGAVGSTYMPSSIESAANKIGVHKGETSLTSTGRYMPLKVAIYHKVLTDIYQEELQDHAREDKGPLRV